MSGLDGAVNDEDCRLANFERNRYFNGKLMTARDMLAEQGYHVDRANTLARTALGEGIVRGLDVTSVTATNTDFTAEVAAGVALDSCGRLLVVPESVGSVPVVNVDTGEAAPPSTNEVYLYLHYDDCHTQTVPALGSENGCDDVCEYNRVLEQFGLYYREVQPGTDPANLPKDGKPVPEIAFPTGSETNADEADALHRMARSYYEEGNGDKTAEAVGSPNGDPRPHDQLSAFPGDDDRTVFLGAFASADGGASWDERRGEGRPERPYVYSTDFLHAALARHVTDFGNAHEVLLSVLAADTAAGRDHPVVRTADGPAGPAFSDGDVQFRSPEGSIDVVGEPGADGGGDGLAFDLKDEYRTLLDTTFPEHIADRENPHEVLLSVLAADSAAGRDNPVVRTADGPAGPEFSAGDVQFRSPEGSIDVVGEPGPDGGGDGVALDLRDDFRTLLETTIPDHIGDTDNPHGVTADQIGPILRVGGQDLGAVVELRGEGVTLDVSTDPNVVTIRAEGGGGEDPNPLKTRFGRHVVERALYAKCAAFRRVRDLDVTYPDGHNGPFHFEFARELLEQVDEAIMSDSYRDGNGEIDPDAITDLLREIADLEAEIGDGLEAVEEEVLGLERYRRAVERLFETIENSPSEEEAAVDGAMAQELVVESADCLRLGEE